MDEDRFNMSLRKFLKKVGITAQREIEGNIRNAMAAGKLAGEGRVTAGPGAWGWGGPVQGYRPSPSKASTAEPLRRRDHHWFCFKKRQGVN